VLVLGTLLRLLFWSGALRRQKPTSVQGIGGYFPTQNTGSMKGIFTVLALWVFAFPGAALGQWYFGAEVGGGLTPALTMQGQSNDRPSVCDEYINPLYASVPLCMNPNRGEGSGWRTKFAATAGLLGNITLGYQVSPSLWLEVEPVIWQARYNDHALVGSATGNNLQKLQGEIILAEERLGTFTSVGGFANVYYGFTGDQQRLTFYLGAGIGLTNATVDYTSMWARNTDPGRIETGEGEPNAVQIRQNLAGTFSYGRGNLQSMSLVPQVMIGLDWHVSDRISIGPKIRYIRYPTYESTEDLVWNPLRSHAPNLRRDGSEPVHGTYSTTSGISAFVVGLQVKNRF